MVIFSLLDGVNVWVPDVDALWLKAKIVKNSGKSKVEVKFHDSGQQKSIDIKKALESIGAKYNKEDLRLPMCNDDLPAEGIADMCSLNHLHEPAVLMNLSLRHKGQSTLA